MTRPRESQSGSPQDREVRREAEKSLRESETLYRALIETTGTGYVVIDTEGRVLDANAEYARLAGRADAAELRGKSVLQWTADYHSGEKRGGRPAVCQGRAHPKPGDRLR